MNGLWYNDFVLVIGAGGNSSDVSYRVHRDGEICIIKILLTNAQKPVIVKNRFGVLLDRQALTGHKYYFLMFMGVSAFFDAFFTENSEIIICQKVLQAPMLTLF